MYLPRRDADVPSGSHLVVDSPPRAASVQSIEDYTLNHAWVPRQWRPSTAIASTTIHATST